ncbi:MAG TPA: HWE histidine kinase domain-containing protein [Caulobacter sp.]|nr:HWE histidine kinase domain-containing protein [Caulobacter sp.]
MTSQPDPNRPDGTDFLRGGGELGALIRAHDWAATPLGPPGTWSQPLKTAVRLLLSTGHPMFLWWGPDLIQFYNDAYRRSIGPERHPGAVGQRGRDCWQEIWPIIGPQIEQVMAGGEPTWHENALVPITRNGRLEEVYWTYSYGPVHDEAAPNGVGGVLVVCTETTEAVLADRRRAETVTRWRRLFDQAPSFMCILGGPDHVFEFVNDAHRALFGSHDWIDRPIREAFPELAGQGVYETLDAVYATGERRVFEAAPLRFRGINGGPATLRYLDFVCAPIIGDDGAVVGIFWQGVDITARKDAETHLRLMVNELNHRVKNSLATVQAIAAQTLHGDAVPDHIRNALTERLIALARAHDVLTDEKWVGAGLSDIAARAAAPHLSADHGDRFVIEGPPVHLPPRSAIAVALALHELATNAAKYGALSVPEGRVRIDWTTAAGEAGDTHLRMTWRESGGPPVSPPRARGFGSRLIERGLATELRGRVRIDYPPSGVICTADAIIPAPDVIDWDIRANLEA